MTGINKITYGTNNISFQQKGKVRKSRFEKFMDKEVEKAQKAKAKAKNMQKHGVKPWRDMSNPEDVQRMNEMDKHLEEIDNMYYVKGMQLKEQPNKSFLC